MNPIMAMRFVDPLWQTLFVLHFTFHFISQGHPFEEPGSKMPKKANE